MRGLPITDSDRRPSRTLFRIVFPVFLLLATGLGLAYRSLFFEERAYAREFLKLPVTCPAQSPAIAPLLAFQPVEDYPTIAAARLSGAIRVQTETFDGSSSNGEGTSFSSGITMLLIRLTRPII